MEKANLLKAIDWQRGNAPNLIKMISLKNDWHNKNCADFWVKWEKIAFNLQTANDFGLAIWSILLDVPLYRVEKASSKDYPAFGFGYKEAGKGAKPFNLGGFGRNSDASVDLTTEQKRIALKLKALAIYGNCSTKYTNKALAEIFGKGVLWCIDNLDMSISYSTKDLAIKNFADQLLILNLLPKPCGVEIKSVHYMEPNIFGYGDQFKQFEKGVFKKI